MANNMEYINQEFLDSFLGDGFEHIQPPGRWADDSLSESEGHDSSQTATTSATDLPNSSSFQSSRFASTSADQERPSNPPPHEQIHPEEQQQRPQHSYNRPPQEKQCRICLDTTTSSLPDPELGRLISPCKCRGSARYVHEECLCQWRLRSADKQAFYKCPTCKFEYRFRRLQLAQILASTGINIAITFIITFAAIFILGYIADPIINLYVDGLYTSSNFHLEINGFSIITPHRGRSAGSRLVRTPQSVGIVEHMLRGLSALGILGFMKVLIFTHSWLRLLFGVGGRRAGGGRERLDQLSWIIIIWGVVSFLYMIWGWVRDKTRVVLDTLAEGVVDIQSDGPEDIDGEGIKEE